MKLSVKLGDGQRVQRVYSGEVCGGAVLPLPDDRQKLIACKLGTCSFYFYRRGRDCCAVYRDLGKGQIYRFPGACAG